MAIESPMPAFVSPRNTAVRIRDPLGDDINGWHVGRYGWRTCDACFALVFLYKKILKQVAQELRGDILGSKCRAVEQLEEVVILLELD